MAKDVFKKELDRCVRAKSAAISEEMLNVATSMREFIPILEHMIHLEQRIEDLERANSEMKADIGKVIYVKSRK